MKQSPLDLLTDLTTAAIGLAILLCFFGGFALTAWYFFAP